MQQKFKYNRYPYDIDLFSTGELDLIFANIKNPIANEKIENFKIWLENSSREFISSHGYVSGLEYYEQTGYKKEDYKRFLSKAEKLSFALIELIGNSNQYEWDNIDDTLIIRDELSDHELKRYQTRRFNDDLRYWNSHTEMPDNIEYEIWEQINATEYDLPNLITNLVALNITINKRLKSLPPSKKGRKKKLEALNAFALGFALQYRQAFNEPFSIMRYINSGKHSHITNAQIIFSRIIKHIEDRLMAPVTDANITNALEYAQSIVNQGFSTPKNIA